MTLQQIEKQNNGMNDKHQEVMERVYDNKIPSFIKQYAYKFKDGTKYSSEPLDFDKQREEVKLHGCIKEMIPVEMLPSEEKTIQ